ncbi:MAG: 50S ribosomal protein L17 [Candidatus Nealsonbacteria bacterium]
MKKKVKGRKFGREKDQRKALLKSLARSIFLNEKIKTTEAKAKEVSGFVEKLITRSIKGDLATIRYLSGLFDKELVKKIVNEIGPRYKNRPGGYTRIIKVEPRKTDGSKMAIIEFVK